MPSHADRLAAFAKQNKVKFSHIELDRGDQPSQPMITIKGRGTLAEQRELAQKWLNSYFGNSWAEHRVKIEAAPGNAGVPQTDDDARRQPADRYFEHHVKLVLPDTGAISLVAITELVVPHGARLSRNARRRREDGSEERFVTQRCYQVGLATARGWLDALTTQLRAHGYEIAEIEQEYVVYDSNTHFDSGWMTNRHANLANEPQFVDEASRIRWRQARRDAMAHVLRVIAGSPYAKNLVLRGSVALQASVGDEAREPGDLDFVVVPQSLGIADLQTREMYNGIIGAVHQQPAAGLTADRVSAEDIWSYDRAPGRRLIFPFAIPRTLCGVIQVDFVFGEWLPVPPEMVRIPLIGEPVLTATAELSLAWKLLWLETDDWPKGKDLYDAVLLAEHTAVSRDLLRAVLRREVGGAADSFTAASVLQWEVDWDYFRYEYPTITGDLESWQIRLALALARSFGQ